MPSMLMNRLAGGLLVLVTFLVMLEEWVGLHGAAPILFIAVLSVTCILTTQVARGRQAFAAVAVALTIALILRGPGWQEVLLRALHSGAFITAFFCALATLRSAAEPAPQIRAGGTFLAKQPPGRRYLALTLGGTAFALLLNYGAIALLGSLATAAAAEEPDLEIREHRRRRMLLAIQRGFTASLPWSPLSFAVAISVALVPGASWGGMLIPALGTALIMTLIGWSLDSIFKPRLSHPAPARKKPEGSWSLMLPLLALLAILVTGTLGLSALTGIRIIGIVLLLVPVMALIWVWLQSRSGGEPLGARVSRFAFVELPSYRGEVVLLVMAGYIGTVGAPLFEPLVRATGFHPETLPPWIVLTGLIWLIPLAGQIGMNPILAVTLFAPLLPTPAALGVPPSAVVAAITAGWALGGVSSPFTATTLLTGSFGNVSARHVGLRWNGGYMLVALVALPVWINLYAWAIT